MEHTYYASASVLADINIQPYDSTEMLIDFRIQRDDIITMLDSIGIEDVIELLREEITGEYQEAVLDMIGQEAAEEHFSLIPEPTSENHYHG